MKKLLICVCAFVSIASLSACSSVANFDIENLKNTDNTYQYKEISYGDSAESVAEKLDMELDEKSKITNQVNNEYIYCFADAFKLNGNTGNFYVSFDDNGVIDSYFNYETEKDYSTVCEDMLAKFEDIYGSSYETINQEIGTGVVYKWSSEDKSYLSLTVNDNTTKTMVTIATFIVNSTENEGGGNYYD